MDDKQITDRGEISIPRDIGYTGGQDNLAFEEDVP